MKHAVVLCVLLASSVSTLSARTPGQQPEGFPAAGAPAIVTMISTGAAPRSALRYTPAAGTRQQMDMTVGMTMAMEVGGNAVPAMTLPTVRIGADCLVSEVAPSGDVTFTMAFTGTDIDAGADPTVATQFQGMYDALKSVKGSATISNRGVTRTSSFDFGAVTNSQLGQSMGSMMEALKQVSIPLPEEEVGVGARWVARSTFAANGLTLFQKTEFELVSFDGKTMTLKSKAEQSALPQAISNPALPPGAEVQLEHLTGGGSGTLRLNLNELVPVSDATLDSTMVMKVAMGGNAQQMTFTTSLKLTIAPGK